MIIPRILIGVMIALTILFLSLQIFHFEVEASGIRALLIITLTTLYSLGVKKKNLFFFLFLVTFAVAEVLTYINWLVPIVPRDEVDYFYFLANSIYLISYTFLIIKISISMNVVEVLKRFPIHILILIILDVFSVIVVTNTTITRLSHYEYFLELVYNAVIMVLLTVALINYIQKDDKKAINLLMGAIFIFFSEVIQLAYFYISEINLLNVICSLFLVLAFFFFYLQSRLIYQPQEASLHQDLVQ